MTIIPTFILISEFFQHVVIIVLAGYLVVEFFAGHGKCDVITCKPQPCAVFGNRRHEVWSILLTVFVVGSMIIGEYFFTPGTVLLQLAYHLPALVFIFYVLLLFYRVRHQSTVIFAHRSLLWLYMLLLPLIAFELALGFYDSTQSWLLYSVTTSLLKTAETFALYAFIIRHMVYDTHSYEKK